MHKLLNPEGFVHSNAQTIDFNFMLSGELATYLSERPFSFSEFLSASSNDSLVRSYNRYIGDSSFPYTLELAGNTSRIREYLMDIYNSVVLKDILGRGRIADPLMLESIIRFVFANIGNLLSTTKIANTMTGEGRRISVHTVENYLFHLLNAFLIYRVNRYDVVSKQHLKTGAKYYTVDIGLRFALLGRKDADLGHILENIVFLELFRRGYQQHLRPPFFCHLYYMPIMANTKDLSQNLCWMDKPASNIASKSL